MIRHTILPRQPIADQSGRPMPSLGQETIMIVQKRIIPCRFRMAGQDKFQSVICEIGSYDRQIEPPPCHSFATGGKHV